MAFLRRSTTRHQLAVSMSGVKLGDHVLFLGCPDGARLGEVAVVVGLSGRAVAVCDGPAAAARAERGARTSGVLVEIEDGRLPRLDFDDGSFDLVVVDSGDDLLARLADSDRQTLLGESHRVLRPGGRLVAYEPGSPGSIEAIWKRQPPATPYRVAGGAEPALRSVGFHPVRRLADRDGLVFVEAMKAR